MFHLRNINPDPLTAWLRICAEEPGDPSGGGGGDPAPKPDDPAGGDPDPGGKGDDKSAAAIRRKERTRANAMVKAARATAVDDYVADLGVDLDELKAWADTKDTSKATERKQQREFDRMRQDLDTTTKQLSKQILENRVLEVAAPLATNPKTVLLHLKDEGRVKTARTDDGKLKLQILDSSGEVDPDAKLETVIKDFLTRNPELQKPVGGPGGGSPGSGAPGTKPPPKGKHDLMTPRGTQAALQEGMAKLSQE